MAGFMNRLTIESQFGAEGWDIFIKRERSQEFERALQNVSVVDFLDDYFKSLEDLQDSAAKGTALENIEWRTPLGNINLAEVHMKKGSIAIRYDREGFFEQM